MILDEIKELQKKAGSYDTLKEEYDRLLIKVRELMNGCEQILKENDYTFVKSSGHGRTKNPYYDKVYNLIKDDSDFIATGVSIKERFPELDELTIRNIMQKLKKYPEIEFTKEGRKLSFFYRKKEKPSTDEKTVLKFDKVSVMG